MLKIGQKELQVKATWRWPYSDSKLWCDFCPNLLVHVVLLERAAAAAGGFLEDQNVARANRMQACNVVALLLPMNHP